MRLHKGILILCVCLPEEVGVDEAAHKGTDLVYLFLNMVAQVVVHTGMDLVVHRRSCECLAVGVA